MMPGCLITGLRARAFTVPTDLPEADGTLAWTETTLVLVEITAGGQTGIGYSYADAALARLLNGKFKSKLVGQEAMDIPRLTATLWGSVRNLGRGGLAACAISAADAALWDLKARLLGLPLATLLGRRRDSVAVYGSGGFTSYDDTTLQKQLAGWAEREGCGAVKMKIGSEPERDPRRLAAARRAIGADIELFADANGAFDPRGALRMGEVLRDFDVRWYEEPVSSDDRVGLAFVRAGIDGRMDIAAGEYSYTLDDVRMMLGAGAVDVQQADATRCGGITGFLQAAALCEAHHIDLSGHCAPSLHLHAACAAPRFRNLEYFHDHVRIEHMLFDGAAAAVDGRLAPDLSRPGLGLDFKEKDAQAYAV